MCLSRDPIARVEGDIEVVPWMEGVRMIMGD